MQNSTAQPDRHGLFSGIGRAFKPGGLFNRGPAGAGLQAQRARPPGLSSDRRTLDAVALLNSAHGDAAIAHALAEALRLSTGSALAAVLLPVHNTRAFTLTALSAEEDTASLNILRGAVDTSVSARRAIENGAAIAIGENLSADALPAWARARKYASGLVAPVTSGDHTLALIYVLTHGTTPESVEQIEGVELLLSIAARHLGRPTSPTEPRKDTTPLAGAQPAPASPVRPAATARTLVSTTQSRAATDPPIVRTEPVRQPSATAPGPVPPASSATTHVPGGSSPLEGRAPTVAGGRVEDENTGTVTPVPSPATTQPVARVAYTPPAPVVTTPRPAATPTPIARFLPDRPAQRLPLTAVGINLDPARESAEVLGTRVSLSSTEFSLLYALASAGQIPVTLGQFAQACWDETGAPSANAVEVALSRLKRRLARAPGGEGVIRTVQGQGYRLSTPQLPASAAQSPDKLPGSPERSRETAAAAD